MGQEEKSMCRGNVITSDQQSTTCISQASSEPPRGPRPSSAPCSRVRVGSCPAGPAEARDPHAAPRVFSLRCSLSQPPRHPLSPELLEGVRSVLC